MYNTEAPKNAFRELTMDEIEKYMPRHYKNCDPIAYEQVKKNGKIFAITTSTPDVRCTMMAYRKDLADKYGIADLNRMSDFTPYFKAIAENETDILPMYLSNSYDVPAMNMANEAGNEISDPKILYGLCYSTEDTTIALKPLYEDPYLTQYKTSWNLMKSWYDAGYVNKDVLSNSITSRDSFLEGKSAICIGNSVDMQSVLASATDKGYDVGLVPILDQQGKTIAVSYTNNDVAIAASCKNPERTMMLLDLLMEDPDYNNLAYFGIESENYVVTADNKIGLPDGVTSETNTYPPDASGLWFLNKDQHLPLASWSDDYIALKNQIPDMLYNQKFAAFAPDLTNIQTETANITNVLQQYEWPLNVGMVDDVDAAIETLKQKLIDAGIEKVQTELQAQADTFMGQ
jgi:putative aldouronate transport system substrate-binding protein